MAISSQNPDGGRAEDGDALALRLLRQGKFRAALSRAKNVHKARPTPASGELLWQCYLARVREMRAAGQNAEAEALLALVAEAFPGRNPAGELEAAQPPRAQTGAAPRPDRATQVKPADDPLAAALTVLADPAANEADRRAAEAAVAEAAYDPLDLSERLSLLPGHPLAAEARAVAGAFAAVVTRPVSEEEIALPEVSRRSPLAGWKMLIRAIRQLQRREDREAGQALKALQNMRSAAAALAPSLQLLIDGRQENLPGPMRRIFSPWRPREKRLPAVLARLDGIFPGFIPDSKVGFQPFEAIRKKEKNLLAALRDANDTIRLEAPELAGSFRELAVAKTLSLTHLPLPDIEKSLGGPLVRSASFWRAAAVAFEERLRRLGYTDRLPDLCEAWEAFLRHGVAEGVLPANGAETAEVYRHLAKNLMECEAYDPDNLDRSERFLTSAYCYGPEQPAAVRALAPAKKAWPVNPDPLHYFAAAAKIHPASELYREWLEAARQIEKFRPTRKSASGNKGRVEEEVLAEWSRCLPQDPAPWLILMQEAEKRNALTLAQKYLARAEAVDPMNADLTRGKWRLALATCRRHLKQGKAHLVGADIGVLEGLQRYGPENARWLLAALDWVIVSHLDAESKRRHAKLLEAIGAGAAGESAVAMLKVVILGLSHRSLAPGGKQPSMPPPPVQEADLAVPAVTATLRLLGTSGFAFGWLKESPWPEWFAKERAAITDRDLSLVAETMLPSRHFGALFKVTEAALVKTPLTAVVGEALITRAKALILANVHWQMLRLRRCLRATAEIARRTGDRPLLEQAGDLVRQLSEISGYFYNAGQMLAPLEDAGLNGIVKLEAANSAFPKANAADPHVTLKLDDEDGTEDFDDDLPFPFPPVSGGGKPGAGFDPGDVGEMAKVIGEIIKHRQHDFAREMESILGDMNMSKPSVKILTGIVTPTLLATLQSDGSIGDSIFEFIAMKPELLLQVMAALPQMPPEDARKIERELSLAYSNLAKGGAKPVAQRRKTRR